MSDCKRSRTIRGLEVCGFERIPTRTRKYLVFQKPGGGDVFLVGRCGALRVSTRTIAESRSLTDTRMHDVLAELGNPAIRWESSEQARETFTRLMKGGVA